MLRKDVNESDAVATRHCSRSQNVVVCELVYVMMLIKLEHRSS